MAKIQHKAIVDPNIHEPKGITLASLGQAYLADGSGSGTWSEVVTPETGTVTASHVGCTFSRSGSYSSPQNRVERLSANFSQKEVRGDAFTVSGNYILIKEKGFYMITFDTSLSTGVDIKDNGWTSSSFAVSLSESDSTLVPVSALWGTTPTASAYKNKGGTNTGRASYIRTFSDYFPANSRLSLWMNPFKMNRGSSNSSASYSVSGKIQLTKIPEIV